MGAGFEAFRKKGADYEKLWGPTSEIAFKKTRELLSENVTLVHMDHWAAAHPEESGRPLEMFIDASDFAWSATLCQRPEPHKAPKIVAITTKAFSDTQLRWSAMERELFALWRGVVSHEADHRMQNLLLH